VVLNNCCFVDQETLDFTRLLSGNNCEKEFIPCCNIMVKSLFRLYLISYYGMHGSVKKKIGGFKGIICKKNHLQCDIFPAVVYLQYPKSLQRFFFSSDKIQF